MSKVEPWEPRDKELSGLSARTALERDARLLNYGSTRKGTLLESLPLGVITLTVPVLAPIGTVVVISETQDVKTGSRRGPLLAAWRTCGIVGYCGSVVCAHHGFANKIDIGLRGKSRGDSKEDEAELLIRT